MVNPILAGLVTIHLFSPKKLLDDTAHLWYFVCRVYKNLGGHDEFHYQLQLKAIMDIMGNSSFLKVSQPNTLFRYFNCSVLLSKVDIEVDQMPGEIFHFARQQTFL